MTAMNPHRVTDDENVTLPKELVLPEKMTEQATLEREYIKPPARSRALRRFPVLAVYGAACFSLALISPYIPHLVRIPSSILMTCKMYEKYAAPASGLVAA